MHSTLPCPTPPPPTLLSGCGTAVAWCGAGGGPLELAHKTRVIVFDKTGTLTQGKATVQCVRLLRPPLTATASPALAPGGAAADCDAAAWSVGEWGDGEGWDMGRVLRLLAVVEAGSEHPLGQALVQHATSTLRALQPPPSPQEGASPGGSPAWSAPNTQHAQQVRTLPSPPSAKPAGLPACCNGGGDGTAGAAAPHAAAAAPPAPRACCNGAVRAAAQGGAGGPQGAGDGQALDFEAVPGRGMKCRWVQGCCMTRVPGAVRGVGGYGGCSVTCR